MICSSSSSSYFSKIDKSVIYIILKWKHFMKYQKSKDFQLTGAGIEFSLFSSKKNIYI